MQAIDPEEWRQIKAIAADAAALPPSSRASYIDVVCAGDDRLRLEVHSLVEAMEHATTMYEQPSVAISGDNPLNEFADPPPVSPGTRVGAYRLVKQIGRGGMGTVYLAHRADGEFEQQVAIKFVGWGIHSPILLDRFREERRILATLDHPNIARLLDGGTTPDGMPFVVMEYVEGVPIDEYIGVHRLAIRERVALYRAVCEAVHFAHQRLVVHRDIKAANILVTADGTPKLLDFGVAKLADPTLAPNPTLVRAMTPESASPEQVRGEPVTIAADVYALGVLLYGLLTGRSPYSVDAGNDEQLIRAICEITPAPPSAAVRERQQASQGAFEAIDRDLDFIVLKALRKEPERRYSTALQLSSDLDAYLSGAPVLAGPDTTRYRAGKLLRRHRVAVAAIVIVMVAIVGGASVALWQARVARNERATAQQRLDMVRKLAESIVFDVNGALQSVPGTVQARRLVVSKALEYLNELQKQAGDDQPLMQELADAYVKIGDIQGNPYQSNIGDDSGALASYGRAKTLYERLAQSAMSHSVRRGQVVARESIGNILWSQGRFEEAIATYREQLALAERAMATEREDDSWHDAIGRAYYLIGQSQLRREQLDEATASYAKSIEHYTVFTTAHPDNGRGVRNMAVALLKTGDVQFEQMQLTLALDSYTAAAQTYERYIAQHGSDADSTRTLAYMNLRAAEALMSLERYREAADRARTAVASMAPALRVSAGDAQLADDEGYSRSILATALEGDQRHGEALEEYARATSAYRRSLAVRPEYIETRRGLGTCLENLGELQLHRHDTSAAIATLREAAHLLDVPEVRVTALQTLAMAYLRLGDAEMLSRRGADAERARITEQATRWYVQSSEVWKELAAKRALSASDQRSQHEAESKSHS